MKKRNICISILIISMIVISKPYIINSEENKYTVLNEGVPFDSIYGTYQEALVKYNEIVNENGVAEIKRNDKTVFIEDGVVIFPEKPVFLPSDKKQPSTTEYKDAFTKTSTYTVGSYGRDATLISYNDTSNEVRFAYAGSEGIINLDRISLVSYQKNNAVNSYYVNEGKLYHQYTYFGSSKVKTYQNVIGIAPEYMQEGVYYYGHDNHYFYNSYHDLIQDLQEEENIDYFSRKHTRSINPDKPHYNYYQLLSHRTYTTYTSEQIDKYINDNTISSSKLRNLGKEFVDKQNKYGANALMMLGVSINESGWGTSSIAINKNNLFGHAAYDSDPYGSANGYSSPAFSIYWHAYKFVSDGYMNPADWRYFGSSLGTKSSGMAVKYASDPYWGEKAAQTGWSFNSAYPGNSDLNNYTLGIINTFDKVYIRKEPTTQSKYLYTTTVGGSNYTSLDYSFIILESVKGETVKGSDIWYKIRSDGKLKDDRSGYYKSPSDEKYPNYYYNRDISYAYVHSSCVNIVNQGKNIEGELTFLPEVNPNPDEINFDELIKALDVAQKDQYLSGFFLNTKLSQIQSELKKANEKVEFSFVDADGKEIDLATDSIVKTGQKMILSFGEQKKEYIIVIKGDTNGDGIINDVDYIRVRKHLSVKEFPDYHLTGAQLEAANVKSDDALNDIDYIRIRKHLSTKEFPDYSIDGMK